jgi:hypothetical protein
MVAWGRVRPCNTEVEAGLGEEPATVAIRERGAALWAVERRAGRRAPATRGSDS